MNIKTRIAFALAAALAVAGLAGTAVALDQGPTYSVLAGNVSSGPRNEPPGRSGRTAGAPRFRKREWAPGSR
ncbi:hypothetical protein, partial [Streptomyces sp. NPDC003943]